MRSVLEERHRIPGVAVREQDPTPLVDAVDKIVGEMHDDGTLTEFSKKWYDGVDLTVSQQ